MKNKLTTPCLAIFSLIFIGISCAEPPQEIPIVKHTSSYYFDTPATNWNEAIPIGNGRLGGMVFGGVEQERIQTNDDTFWSGEPRELQNDKAIKSLPTIRQLLLDDKTEEAQKLINAEMLGPYNQSYLPFADIVLDMGIKDVSNYRRELDLSSGIVTISYEKDGVKYKREVFSSFPNQAIVINMSADKSNALNFEAGLESQVRSQTSVANDQVILKGRAPIHTEPNYVGKHEPTYADGRGMGFEGRLLVTQKGGSILPSATKLKVADATSATLMFVAATSYNGYAKNPATEGKDETLLCSNYLSAIKDLSYDKLKSNHTEDFKSLFNRVSIDLGNNEVSALPINKRVENFKPETDPSLVGLYFQFGRYLLISASRPGSQPSNLQGIWNKDMQPAWSSNWTVNCNTQINYWPVELANLSECHLPLIDMIREASVDGAKTAKALYGADGWIIHHNIDIWRTTWPIGGSGLWAIYQVGGAWLCQHIWDHYQFTQDKVFLKENYPLLKGAVQFYLDNLQQDKAGLLVTNPSESFENTFLKPDGKGGWACVGAAQDMQIIRSLFQNTMKTIDVLGEDAAFKTEVEAAYNKLAPMRISPRTGRLQEWNDDWSASSPRNGQVAHGWGLVASDLITLRGTPELATAFRKTLEHRKPGLSDKSGSWTGAFPAGFWTRLEEGDKAHTVLDRHLKNALFPNLTSNFRSYWEIDGNLGMTFAIGEMLLQSHAGEINLLPALPTRYPTGSVSGLKARGAYEVSIRWKDSKLKEATIHSEKGGEFVVRYQDEVKSFKLNAGETVTLNGSLSEV